ncbi:MULTISPECIES: hypothetical protein [unclassified Eikenella]|uniref:hypothetical protein n=1 Tax=unclassified Eikenella TaxID=2639367 RepID=UPI0008A51835|nr:MULTISPECIES: hypothetical protein [unclassified Eikenella]OFK88832.1 hypothetical protein HMPREF2796_03990 [Eikenella sp. HMSC071B05]OFO47339.1 hypothetical protein HMPREF3043_01840 [Eikenella sp. HMSC073A11]
MTVYYYQNGFLDTDGEAPAGAVELTAAEHEALIVGQSQGQVIMPGKDGKPVLAEPAPSHLHQWNGKEWTLDKAASSQLLAEAIDNGTKAINDLVDEAYRHVTRFWPEYQLREQQAIEYKAGGYKGELPTQVAAFAEPTGKGGKEATDIILAQAAKLRVTMEQLGILRMKKLELKNLKTAAEVDKRAAEIVAAIQPHLHELEKVGK